VVRCLGQRPPQANEESVPAERGQQLGRDEVDDAANDADEQGQDDGQHGAKPMHAAGRLGRNGRATFSST